MVGQSRTYRNRVRWYERKVCLLMVKLKAVLPTSSLAKLVNMNSIGERQFSGPGPFTFPTAMDVHEILFKRSRHPRCGPHCVGHRLPSTFRCALFEQASLARCEVCEIPIPDAQHQQTWPGTHGYRRAKHNTNDLPLHNNHQVSNDDGDIKL